MKFLNWIKQEYIIDSLLIDKMVWLTLFCWLPVL